MLAQVLAVGIFVFMFAMIILDKIGRQVVTLFCGLLTLILVFGLGMHSMEAVVNTLNLRSIFTLHFWYSAGQSADSSTGINWETIIFIAGMMVMVEGMARAGFFRWLCLRLAKLVNYKTIPIFIVFMIMSSFLAMFIDSITVILFLASVTVELAALLKFNPVPMLLSEIFCANLGGSATMCGDPPNIIIGTSLGYSFSDFISNTGVLAGISLIFVIIYFYLIFKKDLQTSQSVDVDVLNKLNPSDSIKSKKDFTISCLIFLCAIVMLVSHAQTGLTVSFIGLFIAIITLITSGKDAVILIKKIDYKTLLFFVGLFIVVSGLEETGILVVLADLIGKISGGNMKLMIAIIVWLSAIASAFVDNIPFAATMIPVIKSLAASGQIGLPVLAWALAIGTDVGGSATPIGASANVVGTSVAAKAGHPISWKRYCTAAVPATAIVLVISMLGCWFRYL